MIFLHHNFTITFTITFFTITFFTITFFQAPYLEKKLRKIYEGEAYKFYRQSDKVFTCKTFKHI